MYQGRGQKAQAGPGPGASGVTTVGLPDSWLSNSSTLSGADRVTRLPLHVAQAIDVIMVSVILRGVNELDSALWIVLCNVVSDGQ